MGERIDAVLATLRAVTRARVAAAALLLALTFAASARAAGADPALAPAPAPDSGSDADTDSDGAAKAPTGPPPYIDRLIGGGTLAPLKADDGEAAYDSSGPPRFLRLEAVADRTDGSGFFQQEEGLAIDARVETVNFGALSLDGVLRADPLGGSFSLQQRQMPFDGGWFANNGIGTLYTPEVNLARNQYRFYLPTFPVAGVSTEWLRDGNFQLLAGVGEPGIFDGVLLNGFHPLGGILATAGAQAAVGSHWQVAVQAVDEEGVSQSALGGDLFNPGVAQGQVNAVSVFGALAWRGVHDRVQVNFMDSENNQGPAAFGAWLDGASDQGRLGQTWGAFWLGRNLTWGYMPVSADSEGLYYRAAYQSQRWLLDGGVDAARSISGTGLSGALLTGNVRYLLDIDTSVGATGTYRFTSPGAADASVFAEHPDHFGAGRLQFDASTQNGDTLGRLNFDQTWTLPVGMRLMTTVSVTREDDNGATTTGFGGALSGGGPITRSLSWDGSAGYQSTRGAWAASGFSANLGLTQQLGHGLMLALTWIDNRDQTNIPPFGITPIIPLPTPPTVTHSSAFFLTLRYEFSAGAAPQPVGGAAGFGGGGISGRLFLDANDNGERDADEAGAPGVTILLDGRFMVRTDDQGRFDFPLVAPGPHEITVVADNLPLPWMVANEGRRTVTVHAREAETIDIAATRMR